MPSAPSSLRALLVGRTRRRSVRWTLFALLVVSGWLLASAYRDLLGEPTNTPLEPLATAVVVIAVVGTLALPAVHAYRNDGWLVCCLLGTAPGVAMAWSGYFVVGGELSLAQQFGHAVVLGALSGLVIGTVSFGVGVGFSRWHSQR